MTPGTLRRRLQLAETAEDTALRELLAAPDFSQPGQPILPLTFRFGPITLQFVATITRFAAPNSAALEDLHLESWFPGDAATETFCRATTAGV